MCALRVRCKHSNRNSAPVHTHTHSSGHNLGPLQISTECALRARVCSSRCFYVYLHFDRHPSFNKCNVYYSRLFSCFLYYLSDSQTTPLTRKVSGFNWRKRVINLSWFRPIFPRHNWCRGAASDFSSHLFEEHFPFTLLDKLSFFLSLSISSPLVYSLCRQPSLASWNASEFHVHENRIGNHSTVYLFNININENSQILRQITERACVCGKYKWWNWPELFAPSSLSYRTCREWSLQWKRKMLCWAMCLRVKWWFQLKNRCFWNNLLTRTYRTKNSFSVFFLSSFWHALCMSLMCLDCGATVKSEHTLKLKCETHVELWMNVWACSISYEHMCSAM